MNLLTQKPDWQITNQVFPALNLQTFASKTQ